MLGNSGDDRLVLVVILAKSLFKIEISHDVDGNDSFKILLKEFWSEKDTEFYQIVFQYP